MLPRSKLIRALSFCIVQYVALGLLLCGLPAGADVVSEKKRTYVAPPGEQPEVERKGKATFYPHFYSRKIGLTQHPLYYTLTADGNKVPVTWQKRGKYLRPKQVFFEPGTYQLMVRFEVDEIVKTARENIHFGGVTSTSSTFLISIDVTLNFQAAMRPGFHYFLAADEPLVPAPGPGFFKSRWTDRERELCLYEHPKQRPGRGSKITWGGSFRRSVKQVTCHALPYRLKEIGGR